MTKSFDEWNEYKKKLDNKIEQISFYEREVWWCSIGMNIGSEQHSDTSDFSRPVLIFKKWTANIFWGIPLTTKTKDIHTRFKLMASLNENNVENDALVIQMRSFDSRRLVRKITTLNQEEFEQLRSFVADSI